MTIALSFILFPKKFSWFYVMGTFMVLGGGLFASLSKRFGGTEAMKTKVSSIEDADEKDSAEEFKSLIPKSGVIELSLSPKKLGDESFDEIEMREVLAKKVLVRLTGRWSEDPPILVRAPPSSTELSPGSW
eukprot:CAMPEP_0194299982 /NCGR_PEP_ID=MMETSP0169-20130528/61010_1 /TAXON_ID=218684 /ORGANISM="Corethron pennatum, Strain L29A3" /LENGTH=130 /DNA_ID=CAMNT_0039050113 /DNA_START=1038 /DNA_END=1431 /DNA_ORIENTATION=-